MPNVKPPFPNPTVAEVQRRLSALADKVSSVKEADGSVDVKKLEAAVAATGDRALALELESVQHAYRRLEVRDVWTGCSTTREQVRVDPVKLEPAEVQSVMQALLDAKARVAALDTDGDARIGRSEARAADGQPGLPAELAREALAGALGDWKKELAGWNQAVNGIADQVDVRRGLDVNITGAAERHCETKLGTEAVVWAYRELAVRSSITPDAIWRKMRDELDDAERSLLRFVPLFGRDMARGDGPHLDDREVMRFLGTNDLGRFVAEKKAAVDALCGGSYDAWVKGAGIPGAELLQDPDFVRRVDSGC